MKTIVLVLSVAISITGFGRVSAQSFTMEQMTSYPFAPELSSRPGGPEVAWVMAEKGKRNVYTADGQGDMPRRLTNYTEDDGQEITGLSLSPDGKWVVYVRGGDHGGWIRHGPVNAAHAPVPPKVQIFKVSLQGGAPELISEGDDPVIAPNGSRVAFIKEGQAWIASLNGDPDPGKLFTSRGTTGDLEWSPDGTRLLFTSDRGDHSFSGIYTNEHTHIQWIAPAFSQDQSPRWSPDGEQVVFVRRPGEGGIPDSLLARKHQPWSIWTADIKTGEARLIWKAPETLRGSVPTTHGGFNLHWAAGDRIVYLSYEDGWPHLYSIPAEGGTPLQPRLIS